MYKSFIQPYFDYCSVFWEGIGSQLALKLRKLQNRAARIITFSSYESNSGPLLQEIRWDRLSIRRIRLLAIEMFKYLCQKSFKWGSWVSLLDSLCLSPKPTINYPWICVKESRWIHSNLIGQLACQILWFFTIISRSVTEYILPQIYTHISTYNFSLIETNKSSACSFWNYRGYVFYFFSI